MGGPCITAAAVGAQSASKLKAMAVALGNATALFSDADRYQRYLEQKSSMGGKLEAASDLKGALGAGQHKK